MDDIMDIDLAEPFRDVVNRKPKKTTSNMGKPLVLGDEKISDLDPIAEGQKRIFNKGDKRRTKTLRPIKKGGDFISGEF